MPELTREEIEERYRRWETSARAIRSVLDVAAAAAERMVLLSAGVERTVALRKLEEEGV